MNFIQFDYDKYRHPSLRVMRELANLVKKHKVDVIQAFDAIPLLEAYGSQIWHRQPIYGMITAQATPMFRLPKSREIALVNPDTYQRYQHVLGWSKDNMRLIVARLDCSYYRPIAIPPFSAFKFFDFINHIPVVSLISRIDQGKWPTIATFLSAAQHLLNKRSERMPAQFIIVGGGPLLPLLNKSIQTLNCGNKIISTGELLNIPEVMNVSTIVLGMASTCQQGLACGRPVIVLGNLGFSAVVEPDNFDYLASHHFNLHEIVGSIQPETLCSQIEAILDSPQRVLELSKFGRGIACERFDSQIGAGQLEEVYFRLLSDLTYKPMIHLLWWLDLLLSIISYYHYRIRRRVRFALRSRTETI
jgi:glycosyltransferase involved in cell wall biosynthesis